MNIKVAIFSLFVTAHVAGCVSYYRITPVNQSGISQEWQNGISVSTSVKPKSTVVLKVNPLVISDRNPNLSVAVFNATDNRYEFSEKKISVSVNGKEQGVLGRDAWIIKSDKDARARQVALGFAAAANAYNASQNGRSTFYTSWGTFNVYQANQAQSALAAAATAKVYADIARDIKAEALEAIQFAESQMLSINTMLPKAWYGGTVMFDRLPKLSDNENEIVVQILVDDELHRFDLMQSKADEPQLNTKKKRRTCGAGC